MASEQHSISTSPPADNEAEASKPETSIPELGAHRMSHKAQLSTATVTPLDIPLPPAVEESGSEEDIAEDAGLDDAEEVDLSDLKPKSEDEDKGISLGSAAAKTPTPLSISSVSPFTPSAFSPTTATSATDSAGTQLDALLSPKEPNAHFSVVSNSTTDDVITDDERFSTVLLSSARQSMEALVLNDVQEEEDIGDEFVPLESDEQLSASDPSPKPHSATDHEQEKPYTINGTDIVTFVHQNRVHKKTASTSTIVSANNVPFLLGRVDIGEDGELLKEGGSKRVSLDGQLKLQEEFEQQKQQKQSQKEADEIDWDFWGDVVSDYPKFASERPTDLAKAIEHGIPKNLRGMIWQLMSASKDPELEQTYLQLLKETSPHEKAITRDLGRTFPHHAFFNDGQGIGQENLFNVLKAYSLYDPQVGYCQGLPFVAAVLLLNMPDEEAFCLLVRLMHSYDLRGHFLPEMPKLQLRLFQFDRLIEEFLPVLHVHFIRQGIKSNMYCSQWFLTMFSYRFPIDIVFRIYDNCLASGIEAMFAFSTVLLSKNEETLLELKFDQLLNFLNTKVFEVYEIKSDDDSGDVKYDVDQFVHDAIGLKITPFMLDTYAREYDEMVRTRDAHAIEMDALRTSNRNLSSQVNNLESSLAQLNTEHCEILNELVKARLRNEELETELVKYKLLYAEAMHQSEDALSSHRLSANMHSRRGSGMSSSSALSR
ncbi:Rab GTPase-activating TBC domain-containing protein [Abortiporus biennis]